MSYPQCGQRAEVLEDTEEEHRINLSGDFESGRLYLRCDFVLVALDVCVPSFHHRFIDEPNFLEGTLLAPRPPPFRDERRGAETGTWEVVDDLVDDFLRKQIHDELVVAGDRMGASGRMVGKGPDGVIGALISSPHFTRVNSVKNSLSQQECR